jgi:hypothetical protein
LDFGEKGTGGVLLFFFDDAAKEIVFDKREKVTKLDARRPV